MDFMPLRLISSSLTYSICALAAIILQMVAMECQKLHMVDSSITSWSTDSISVESGNVIDIFDNLWFKSLALYLFIRSVRK